MENISPESSFQELSSSKMLLLKRFIIWIFLPILLVTVLETLLVGKESLGILHPVSLALLVLIVFYIPIIVAIKLKSGASSLGRFVNALIFTFIGYIVLILVFFSSAAYYEHHLLKKLEPVSGVSKTLLGYNVYENKSLRYKISYPSDYVAFTKVDAKKNTTVAPTSESSEVFVAKNNDILFCCEPVTLLLKAAGKATDLQEALKKYIADFHYDMPGKIEPIVINRKSGFVINGSGSINSPYRIIVISTGRTTPLLIEQGMPDEELNSIIEKISFE